MVTNTECVAVHYVIAPIQGYIYCLQYTWIFTRTKIRNQALWSLNIMSSFMSFWCFQWLQPWCSTIPHLPGCVCPWTFYQNIGFSMVPSNPFYVTFSYSIWIFCRGVSGFATDCPCDVCNWLSLPPACWSTFWKSIFKHQLGCRFDILDSIS